jgi:hypothetical protein
MSSPRGSICNENIPKSDHSRIIIPANRQKCGFLRGCYHEELLGNFVKDEEFSRVIDRSSSLAAKCFVKQKVNNKDVEKKFIWLMGLAFLLMVVFFVLVYLENDTAYVVSYIFLALSLFLGVFTLFYNYFRPLANFVSFEEAAFLEISTYLNKINNEIFLNRQMKWIVYLGHEYLELQLGQQIQNQISHIQMRTSHTKKSSSFKESGRKPKKISDDNVSKLSH